MCWEGETTCAKDGKRGIKMRLLSCVVRLAWHFICVSVCSRDSPSTALGSQGTLCQLLQVTWPLLIVCLTVPNVGLLIWSHVVLEESRI